MQYFRNTSNNEVFGYDDSDETQIELIGEAIKNGWQDITGSWPPPPPPNPDEPIKINQVSMRQARLALLQAGLLDAIDRHMTEPDQRIWWDYATTVERNHPFVVQVAASISLTDEQVDGLFDLAATL